MRKRWLCLLALALGCRGEIGSSPGRAAGNGGAGGGPTVSAGGTTRPGSAGGGASCTPLPPIPARVWRLSVEQYQSAVADLLGLATPPALANRGGEAQWAFFSDASLGVDDGFQYALFQAIDGVLSQLPDALVTCNAGEAPTTCATRIARSFGARAFRRPLTQDEVDALVTNDAHAAAAGGPAVAAAPFRAAAGDTPTGLRAMVEAILLSPSFVYRTELGAGGAGTTTLTPYEVASQLAFTLLGSIPDEALMAAAANPSPQGLGTRDGVATQIDRLLALPRVQQNLSRVVAGWFNVGQLFSKTHDSSLLSALTMTDQEQGALEADLYTSAQQVITDLLWTKGGAITDLLTSQEVFLNARLDTLYPGARYVGRPPRSTTTFVAGTWPPEQQRPGLLGHPGYFWAQSDPAANSIVKRGKAIHDDVVCADPLPPPIDLSTPAARAVIAMGDSEVTKSDARISIAPCNGCHAQMDPYARVFQNFGPIGNYRITDEVGRPIDASAMFSGSSPLAGQTVAGPADFAKALVASGHFDGCAVQKIASYVVGTMIDTYDTCELQAIRGRVAGGTLGSIFREVLLADFARTRKRTP
jgi:hypothetical protein